VSAVLEGWNMAALADTTELIASELTTNVVQAATRIDGSPRYDEEGSLPLLWLRLLCDDGHLMIEVWDNLPEVLGAPAVQHPDPDEEHGRGLAMVDILSADWGWESVPGWNGKRVWALLRPGE
jgi:hypothetical protein